MLLNTAVEILEDTDMEGTKGTALFLSLRKHHCESYVKWWLWLRFNLNILGREGWAISFTAIVISYMASVQ